MRHTTSSDYDPFWLVPRGHEVAQVVGGHLLKTFDRAEQGITEAVVLVCGGVKEFWQNHFRFAPDFLNFVGCCLSLHIKLLGTEQWVEDGIGKNRKNGRDVLVEDARLVHDGLAGR